MYDHSSFWPTSVTLTFYLPEQMFQINSCVKLFLNSMHKCRSYGSDKFNLWPLYHLSVKCNLDIQSTWTNVSYEQLCQTILKSMHKCRSYGPDKLNLWSSSVTLTFNLPQQMFQMALLLLRENSCAKVFWIPCINVEVMARTSSIHDHCITRPSSVTYNLPVSNATATPTVPNYFEIHA